MTGTCVLTPTGARAIEALRLGDLVISRDETRQMSVVKPVVRLIHNHHQKILSLTLRGSSRDELLGTTTLHPFYVWGHGWVKAGDLHAGDEIVSK